MYFLGGFDPCSVIFLYEVKRQSRRIVSPSKSEVFRDILSQEKYMAILQCIALSISRNDSLNFQGMLKSISCNPFSELLFVLHVAYIDSVINQLS